MATQGHLAALQRAMEAVSAHSGKLYGASFDAVKSKDDTGVRAVTGAAQDLMKDLGPLKQAIADAEKHIKTWASESRWKQVKNVGLPSVTKARKELEAVVKTANGVVNQAHYTLKQYDELRGSMK